MLTFCHIDTAYVLAYSTIMLNTDAHNPQVKNRMTKADFTRNNRGINDGNDLPEDFLSSIFDEITTNEIRMKDEVEATLPTAPGPGDSFAAGSPCQIQWSVDSTGQWTNVSICKRLSHNAILCSRDLSS